MKKMTYTEKLTEAVKSGDSCLCVGLDPNLDLMPDPLRREQPDPAARVALFLKRIIDSTRDHCAAYKPNLGFFEALGAKGLEIFGEILEHIPQDKIVIADAKRGDISSTADHYARAYFDTFDVDAVTINPLMGFETLKPFLDYPEKGIYTLTLTSNPGAEDFLMQPFRGYPSMAEFISDRLSNLSGDHSTHLGMVVGATKAGQIEEVITRHRMASLLIPGVGTQGGSLTTLSKALKNHSGIPLVNSSRSIIYAGNHSEDWQEAVSDKAREFKNTLKSITENYV